jgi:hypothetical protein
MSAFERYKSEPLTEALFTEMCMEHDLTYAYSDDPRYYNAGRDQLAMIREAASKLPPDVGSALWNAVVEAKLMPEFYTDFKW